MLRSKRKGQSTLEYIIVFTAIVAAILGIAYTTLKPAVQGVMTSAANKITNAADAFGNK